MLHYLRAIYRSYKDVLEFIHIHSMPNLKYFKNKREQKLFHMRLKAMLFNQLFLLVIFIMNIFRGNGEIGTNVQGIFCTTLVPSAIFVLKSFHPEVFRIFLNCVMLYFSTQLIRFQDEGVIGAWVSAPTFPMLNYIASGSLVHFCINMGVQILALNVYYPEGMKRVIMFMESDALMKSFSYQTNQAVMYTVAFTIFTHFLMQEALNQADEADKKKEDFERQKNFLLGFSHELRNLINSLIGNVKLASVDNVSEKAKDLLQNAEHCAEMLLHLINNILDTGKVELGDLEINTSPIKIYDIMERMWSVCSEMIKKKHLRGRMKIQKDIPKVLDIDHYRLMQIFLNLVGNAVKYTDAGEIDITVEWLNNTKEVTPKCFEPYPFNEQNDQDEGLFEKKQTLSVLDDMLIFLNFWHKKINRNGLAARTDTRRGILKISVRDTGIGIPDSDIPKLFQRFTQLTLDPSKKKLGTGLGLFITKELCERMNGDVKIFSKLGRGSTFMFCLPVDPVVDDNAYLLDRELIRKLILHKNLKAMVVDDQPLNHFILREFLNKLGVEVVEVAENGQSAYEKYVARAGNRQDCLNVVTMDVYMPIMDGKLSAQKIREFERAKGLDPCLMVMVSANCTESEISECITKTGAIKADAFVKKPATMDEMSRIISSYISRVYHEDEIRHLTNFNS